MKTLLQTTDFKEIDIEIPFYAYVQEGDESVFIKIDETGFKQIRISLSGEYSLFKSRSRGYTDSIWYDNPSTEEQWNKALKAAKHYINKF